MFLLVGWSRHSTTTATAAGGGGGGGGGGGIPPLLFLEKFVGRGEGIETREFMNCTLQLLSDNKE